MQKRGESTEAIKILTKTFKQHTCHATVSASDIFVILQNTLQMLWMLDDVQKHQAATTDRHCQRDRLITCLHPNPATRVVHALVVQRTLCVCVRACSCVCVRVYERVRALQMMCVCVTDSRVENLADDVSGNGGVGGGCCGKRKCHD